MAPPKYWHNFINFANGDSVNTYFHIPDCFKSSMDYRYFSISKKTQHQSPPKQGRNFSFKRGDRFYSEINYRKSNLPPGTEFISILIMVADSAETKIGKAYKQGFVIFEKSILSIRNKASVYKLSSELYKCTQEEFLTYLVTGILPVSEYPGDYITELEKRYGKENKELFDNALIDITDFSE